MGRSLVHEGFQAAFRLNNVMVSNAAFFCVVSLFDSRNGIGWMKGRSRKKIFTQLHMLFAEDAAGFATQNQESVDYLKTWM